MPVAFEATIDFYSKDVTGEPRNTPNRFILLYSDIANTDRENMFSVFYIAKDSEGSPLGNQKLEGSYDCDVYIASDKFRTDHLSLPSNGSSFTLYSGKVGTRNKIIAQGTVTAVLL